MKYFLMITICSLTVLASAQTGEVVSIIEYLDIARNENEIIAGPFGNNNKTYRGIFILNLTSVEEADRILQTDPAIKEKLLDVELYNWYGSAALPEYLKYAEKIWKIKPF